MKIKNKKAVAWDKFIKWALAFLVVVIVIFAIYKSGAFDFLKNLIPDFRGTE